MNTEYLTEGERDLLAKAKAATHPDTRSDFRVIDAFNLAASPAAIIDLIERTRPAPAPQPPGAAMRVDDARAKVIRARLDAGYKPNFQDGEDLLADRADMLGELARLRDENARVEGLFKAVCRRLEEVLKHPALAKPDDASK